MKIRNISISRKLRLATVFGVLLLLLQFGVVYLSSLELLDGLTEIHHHQQLSAAVLKLRQITDSLADIVVDAKGATNDSLRLFDAERDQSLLVLRQVRTLSKNYPAYANFVDRIDDRLEFLDRATHRFLARGSLRAEGEKLISKQFSMDAQETEDAFKEAVDQRANELFSSVYAERHRPFVTAVILTLSFVILALSLGFFFTRRLERSIENVADAARQVAWGNLDLQAPILSNDEIGLLTEDFNSMTKTLKQTTVSRKYVQLLADASSVLAQSIDQTTTIRHILEIIVPRVGASCFVHLTDETGKLANGHMLCADPKEDAEFGIFAKDGSIGAKIGVFLLERAHDRRPAVVPAQLLLDQELCNKSTIRSFVVCPLSFQDRILGALTIGLLETIQNHESRDLALYEELARRATAALENSRLYHEAQEAISLRDEFLSIASHELKTPLTSLSLNLQILDQQLHRGLKESNAVVGVVGTGTGTFQISLPQRTLHIVSGAVQQSQRLAGLLDELLDLTRIRLGKLQLAKEDIDLAALVRNTVGRFKLEASRKGVSISIDVPESLRGHWDPMRIEQVVSNLLSNALKYGNSKPVSIHLCPDMHDGAHVDDAILVVRDEGMGVPPEERERIFERFERAGISGKKISGLGLGLYICRQIVEAHGGSVRVESEVGKGSSFVVRIPIGGLDLEVSS